MRRTTSLGLMVLALGARPARAQDQNKFQDLFSAYSGRSGPGYLKPVAQALGGSLNTGFIRPTRIRRGFHLRLQLETMSAFFSDAQKSFQATTDTGFTPRQTVTAPTIVGDHHEVIVDGEGGLSYVFPAGLEVRRLSLGLPQLTIGNILGTEATVRWFGYSADKVGKFSLLGIGLRHSISQYLHNPPVDLAIGVAFHSVELTSAARLKALIVSAQGSFQRSLLGLYGGLSYESSHMNMDYANSQSPGGRARYRVEGAKGIRATAGLELNLKILRLHADYNLGNQNMVGLGISFGN